MGEIKIKTKSEIKAKSVFRNWSFYLFATSFILMIFMFILIGMYDVKGLIDTPHYYVIAIILGISYFVVEFCFSYLLVYTYTKSSEKINDYFIL
ncbi:hypothetical protein HYW19_02175 [Candidatus Woesearchaeota archaeon]|nr:hypothetical protein [Candidatus Woesearchaeota archaeon]